MSTAAEIGNRLLEIRSRLGYPQSKVAAALDIADRSYKNYEAGKRDLPLMTAISFCSTFSVDFQWLVFGQAGLSRENSQQVFEDSVIAVLTEAEQRNLILAKSKVAKACAFLAMQALAKGSDPKDDVGEILELMR
jgi:DNA-binding XRE family transcriptional regulator